MRRGPPRFVWRFGCGLLLFFAIAWTALAIAIWSAAGGPPAFGRPHPFFGPLPLIALAVLIVVIAAGVFRARGFARPFGSLIDAARRVERGDYSARVPEYGPPDMRSIARAFNAMSSQLEADAARRRNFLADVAHELRTQLAVIRAQTEAIADGVYAADPTNLNPILDTTATLEGLVEDLRTAALSEIGALELKRERVDIAALLEETVAALRPQAEAAGTALVVNAGEPVPPVSVDPVRLRRALSNVITNALRHTPGGSVTVKASTAEGWLTITVIDTGEGIAPELLPHVFERFTKGPNSRGTGLGLAIARDILNAHGGTISAESQPASGTTVTIRLPLDG